MRVRDALLVEELAVHAMRIAEHLHRPVADVREQVVGEVDVVADEVALREAALREEDLVRVRDLDVVAADPHGAEGYGPEITLRGGRRVESRRAIMGVPAPLTYPGVWRRPVSECGSIHRPRRVSSLKEGGLGDALIVILTPLLREPG